MPESKSKNLNCLKPSYQQKKEPVFWEAWNKSGDVVFEAGCHVFGARYYDPVLGRWHSQDPMSQYASPYNAMGNNPVNLIDRWGMCAGSPENGGGGGGGYSGMPSWCDGYGGSSYPNYVNDWSSYDPASNTFGNYTSLAQKMDYAVMNHGASFSNSRATATNVSIRLYQNTFETHTVYADGEDKITSTRTWYSLEPEVNPGSEEDDWYAPMILLHSATDLAESRETQKANNSLDPGNYKSAEAWQQAMRNTPQQNQIRNNYVMRMDKLEARWARQDLAQYIVTEGGRLTFEFTASTLCILFDVPLSILFYKELGPDIQQQTLPKDPIEQ